MPKSKMNLTPLILRHVFWLGGGGRGIVCLQRTQRITRIAFPISFQIDNGVFIAKFIVSRCAFANFQWVFLLRQSFEVGVVLITMQRTHPTWPVKTKLRMTLDWSRLAKEIAMMSGIFDESRRQALLYSCKR